MDARLTWKREYGDRLETLAMGDLYNHEVLLERMKHLGVTSVHLPFGEHDEPMLTLPELWALVAANDRKLRDVFDDEELAPLDVSTVRWFDEHLDVTWDESLPTAMVMSDRNSGGYRKPWLGQ